MLNVALIVTLFAEEGFIGQPVVSLRPVLMFPRAVLDLLQVRIGFPVYKLNQGRYVCLTRSA